MPNPTVYVLNTTVVPCKGLWEVQEVSLDYAIYLVSRKDHQGQPSFTSAIGHDSTAALLSALLGAEIPVNRISVAPAQGDFLLCFKLTQRAPEGKILSAEELEALGYKFFLMELVSESRHDFVRAIRDGELWSSRTREARKPSREFLGGHRD